MGAQLGHPRHFDPARTKMRFGGEYEGGLAIAKDSTACVRLIPGIDDVIFPDIAKRNKQVTYRSPCRP
jgi:hypothetical protein